MTRGSGRCRIFAVGASAVWLSVCLLSSASADVLLRYDGSRIEGVKIQEVTHDQVLYTTVRITKPQRVPAEEIYQIIYADRPSLRAGRAFLEQGQWEKAAESFSRAAGSGEAPYDEAGAFGVAAAYAWRFFETGQNAAEAKEKLTSYLSAYKPKKGFHLPQAVYLAGRVALLAGDSAGAKAHLKELGTFSGNSRRLLSELLKGRIQLASGDVQGAAITFNTVMTQAKRLNMTALWREAVALRGKALVAQKDYQRAIDFLAEYFKGQKNEKAVFDRFSAQASNALADAYAGKGTTEDKWEALYHYLWTTVLYRSWRSECAEAFYKAGQLAKELGQEQDAQRLLARLKRDYGDTLWGRKGT